jgi:DNA primase
MLSANVDKPAEVIFTFDPDEAGQKAAMRAFADADKFHANSFIAIGPNGLDPSDLRVQNGDEAIKLMIENKKPIYEFAIKQKMKNFNLESVEGRVGAARAASAVIAAIRDSALRSVYIRELANWVNLDLSEVTALVDRAIKEKVVSAVAPLRQDVTPQAPVETSFQAPDLNDPAVRFERQLLEVLIQQPTLVSQAEMTELVSGDFLAGAHGALALGISTVLEFRADPNWLPKIAEAIDPTLHSTLRALAATALPAANEHEVARYVAGVVNSGFIALLTRQKLSLQAVLRQIDPSETARISEIQRELISIEERRRKLQGG